MSSNKITRRTWLKGTASMLAATAAAPIAANALLPQTGTTEILFHIHFFSRGRCRPRPPHEVVARGQVWNVHPLGPLQRSGSPRVGDGK